MARYQHLPIFQKAYDLNLEIYRLVHNFPREYKYTLGQKLKEVISELLERIVMANSLKDKSDCFGEIRIRSEKLRIYLRLAFDLNVINSRKFERFNRLILEISKQVSGWEKWFFKNSFN